MSDVTGPAAPADRLARSLRSPQLRTLYATWCARRHAGLLPQFRDIDAAGLPGADDIAIAEAEPGSAPASFRLIRVGPNLERRAQRTLLGERITDGGSGAPDDPLGGAAWAYRRVLDSGAPSYEFAHFSFGDAAPMLFERLLLPVGRGSRATHVIVATLFSEPEPRPI